MIASTSDFISPWVWGGLASILLIVLVTLLLLGAFFGLGFMLLYIFGPK